MSDVTRETVMNWMIKAGIDASICPDCEGIHIDHWETKEAVLEARCFVDSARVSYLVEVAVRPSAVLPIQGAVHFMNFDHSFLKVMITMSDNDVPRLLLTHALPIKHLSEKMFEEWTRLVLVEMEAVYKQLVEMEVLFPESEEELADYDAQLH